MDLLGGIFILLVAILVVVSILLGFVIYNSINLRTRGAGRQRETTNDETQLDRIEGKLDRSNRFTRSTFIYMLGLTAIVVGFAFITSEVAIKESWAALFAGGLSQFARWGWTLVALGFVISIIGLVFRFRTRWSSRR